MLDVQERPFTELLRTRYREGATYDGLSRRCGRVRSTSWIGNLIQSSHPWAVNPPTRDTFAGFAKALGVTEEEVRVAIAREWYGADVAPTPPNAEDVMALFGGLRPEQQLLFAAVLMELRVNGQGEGRQGS